MRDSQQRRQGFVANIFCGKQHNPVSRGKCSESGTLSCLLSFFLFVLSCATNILLCKKPFAQTKMTSSAITCFATPIRLSRRCPFATLQLRKESAVTRIFLERLASHEIRENVCRARAACVKSNGNSRRREGESIEVTTCVTTFLSTFIGSTWHCSAPERSWRDKRLGPYHYGCFSVTLHTVVLLKSLASSCTIALAVPCCAVKRNFRQLSGYSVRKFFSLKMKITLSKFYV